MTAPVLTVDGRSGSGKTTLGRRLARHYSLPLVDTGLVYRGVMVAAVRRGIGADQTEQLAALATSVTLEVNTDSADDPAWLLRVDGEDAGPLLRDPAHALLLSTISQIPAVRRALLPLQRDLVGNGAVAVGRDCGTVVFPDAAVKFYLDAAPDVRVQRREAQLRAGGEAVDMATVIDDVAGRDNLDAPSLVQAASAHVIDTGANDPDAVFTEALRICEDAGLV